MKTKINVKKINQCLFYVLLFFGLFDSARNYTLLPEWFGYSKEAALFFLYILNIKRIRFQIKDRKLIFVQCVYWFLWGMSGIWYSAGYSAVRILIGIIKYLEFFMMIILFSNWDELFPMDMSRAVEQYVLGSCFIIFINIIGCYVPNVIVYRGLANGNVSAPDYYGSRISVGQPPVVAIPMLFSCIYLLCMKKGKKNAAKFCLLAAGILGCVTMTGIAALCICMALYLIDMAVHKRIRKNRKAFAGVILAAAVIFIFHEKLFELFESQITMFWRRTVNYLLGNDGAMNSRSSHWQFALGTLQNGFQWLVGRGMYGFNLGGEYHYIENTFVSMICTYGILGLGLFLLFIGSFIIRLVRGYCESQKEIFLFGLFSALIYLLHMYTLDVLIIYTVTFAFTFFYAYIEKNTKQSC